MVDFVDEGKGAMKLNFESSGRDKTLMSPDPGNYSIYPVLGNAPKSASALISGGYAEILGLFFI